MTTTVYDRVHGYVASDSRWSCDLERFGFPGLVAYVDNTGFGKIAVRGDFILCLAGCGNLIQQWKDWWRQPELPALLPPVEGDNGPVVLYAIDTKLNQLALHTPSVLDCVHLDQDTAELSAVFTGSGQTYAWTWWVASQCAKKSIQSVMGQDVFTGGDVRFVDFINNTSNIENTIHNVSAINHQMKTRGLVVNKHDPSMQPMPIGADVLTAIQAVVAENTLPMSAPHGAGPVIWNTAAKQRLESFVAKVRESESN